MCCSLLTDGGDLHLKNNSTIVSHKINSPTKILVHSIHYIQAEVEFRREIYDMRNLAAIFEIKVKIWSWAMMGSYNDVIPYNIERQAKNVKSQNVYVYLYKQKIHKK